MQFGNGGRCGWTAHGPGGECPDLFLSALCVLICFLRLFLVFIRSAFEPCCEFGAALDIGSGVVDVFLIPSLDYVDREVFIFWFVEFLEVCQVVGQVFH